VSEPRPKVLLVDDVEANLVALEGILGRMSCELVRADSGNEALRLLLRNDFAVVLLDVQMPEMDGYEVAQHARDNPATRHVPIIFVTATHETKESILRGYDAGAFDLLFKPIDPYVLRSKVQVFLDLYLNRLRLSAEIEAHKQTLAEVEAFNYSVSHDLRAPLRPLDGFSEVLLQDYGDKLDARAKDYLVRIRAAARRMGQLIDDLLELSRVSRVSLRRRPVDLSALVTNIVAQLRADDGERSVELVCPPRIEAQADDRVLRIALENLLRNAWKFTAKQPRARIEFGRTPDGTCFVSDDGVGFDPTYAQRLFQPFQRLHGSEYSGTGIGLAIVDRIVRRHEGRIWGESAPGKGATFFFTLSPPTKV
jgi:two-component system sensor histidine kinase/response regulator